MTPPNQSRLEARAIKQSGFKMRSISGGSPDCVNVAVTGKHSDGRYYAKRDHWPIPTVVPVVPSGAQIPVPARARMFFEDGDTQRPFLYWPFGRSRRGRPGGVALDWTNLFATGNRYNQLIGFEFDPVSAVETVGPATTSPAFFFRQYQGSIAWCENNKIFVDGVEIFDGSTDVQSGWDNANFAQWDSLTYVGDTLYLLHSYAAMCAVQTDGTLAWNTVIFSDQGLPGALVGDGYWVTNSDIVLIGNRACAMGYLYDSGIVSRESKVLISVNANDGADYWYWYWEQYAGYDYNMECWNAYSGGPAFWTSGNKVIFEGYSGEVVCLQVNQESPFTSNVWESEFPADGVERRRRVLGIVGDAVICAYEQHEWEQVYDETLEVDWNTIATPDEERYRWTYADPASIAVGVHAGVEALSLADGTQVGEDAYSGNTDWQTWIGPKTDYHASGGTFGWAPPGHWYEFSSNPQTGKTEWQSNNLELTKNQFGTGFEDYWFYHLTLLTQIGSVSSPVFDPWYTFAPKWADKDYNPATDTEWESWKTATGVDPEDLPEFTSPYPENWEQDFAAAEVSKYRQHLIAFEMARHEAMGGTRSSGTDFLIQSFWRLSNTQRFHRSPNDYSDWVQHSLTRQQPDFAALGHPIYNDNIKNMRFVETYQGGLGDFLDHYRQGSGVAQQVPGGAPNESLEYKYLWRSQDERDVQRTPTPYVYTGCSCRIGELLILCGQSPTGEMVQWKAYDSDAVLQWTHTTVGGTLLESAPFADDAGIHTVIQQSSTFYLYTIDADGDFVSQVVCPDLGNPTFNGTDTFIAENGETQFG